MFYDAMNHYMTLLAKQLNAIHPEHIKFVEVLTRKTYHKVFLKVVTKGNVAYGVSYIGNSSHNLVYSIWDSFGKGKNYKEQCSIKFRNFKDLLEHLVKADLDKEFSLMREQKLYQRSWSEYSEEEFRELYGHVEEISTNELNIAVAGD